MPLFCSHGFVQSFPSRDHEVIYSVLAIAGRFSDDMGTRVAGLRDIERNSRTAYELIMGRISRGKIELSTLQAMCLLTLLDLDGECPDAYITARNY